MCTIQYVILDGGPPLKEVGDPPPHEISTKAQNLQLSTN